jgi:biotin transporter BioY
MNWAESMTVGMVPFLPGDALKAAAAVIVAAAVRRNIPEILPRIGRYSR